MSPAATIRCGDRAARDAGDHAAANRRRRLLLAAPYPCYVDRISFDVKELDIDGTKTFEFYLDSFTFRPNIAMARRGKAEDLPDLDERSWLLPGHGGLLRWRSPQDCGNS